MRIVHLRVRSLLREQFAHECYFCQVLRDVRLHPEARFLLERPQPVEELRRAAGREPRSQDRHHQPLARVHLLDGLDAGPSVLHRRFRVRVFVVGRVDVRIHVTAAHKGALAAGVADSGEESRRGDVGRGEIGGGGGAVAERGGNGVVVDRAGARKGGERGFEGKGVCVQPGEEGRLAEDAGVGELRRVDMSVWGGS